MSYSNVSRLCRLGVVLLLLVTFVPAAWSIQPVAQNDRYEIRLPEFMPDVQAKADLATADQQVTRALGSRLGGDWIVHTYNLKTRSPHYVYGKSAPLTSGLRSTDEVESLARRVMAENPEIFFGRDTDLRLQKAPRIRGKWAAHFQQTYKGLDVWQGKTLVVFDDDSRVLLMSNDAYGDIDLDVRPSLSPSMAEVIATESVPFVPGVDRIKGETELLVLSVPRSATEVEHHLVYRVRVRTSDPLGEWVTHIDANDGTIVWRYNDIHFLHEGGTESAVQNDSYCNGVGAEAMPYLRMNVGGNSLITDADGLWSNPGTTGDQIISADLYGPYCDMNNYSGAEAFYNNTWPEGSDITVAFNDLNSQQDERDSFDAVNDIHDYFEIFAPGFAYSNARISTYVSRDDGYCPGNAWWDGTINFCVEGGGYANTGQIQGVVFHEFGHGVQDHILGWQGDEGLGEGNSDILAILLTNDPALGLGFYLDDCANGLRDATNTNQYPDDVVGQPVHSAGKALMGFNWKAQEHLMGLYGEEEGNLIAARNWHDGRILLQPTNQPDQVFAMFFIDDDDNDLTNGTPHHESYCQAAGIHNYECPEILFGVIYAHDQLLDTLDTSGPYAVTANIYSTEAVIDDSSVQLTYRSNGGPWTTVPMVPTGTPEQYQGQIPGSSAAIVEYYLEASDVAGNSATEPEEAPAENLSFAIASSADYMEIASGWTEGDSDDDASTGQWVRVDPVGTSAQPEDDHTTEGAKCWVTGQHASGQSDGYADIDGGKTTLFSPVYDLTGFDQAHLRYWKWYSNNRGNAPNQDFWSVMVSGDGGSSWESVEYTSQSTNAWVAVTIDLLDHLTVLDQVQMKFVASDEGTGSLVEAGIDDFMIIAFNSTSAVGDDMISLRPTQLGQNRPNPFNPITEISFNLAQAGPVKLAVYDVTGRLVRTLVQENLDAGPQLVRWNGSGNDGRTVASGVYFYRLQADGQSHSKRMMLLK